MVSVIGRSRQIKDIKTWASLTVFELFAENIPPNCIRDDPALFQACPRRSEPKQPAHEFVILREIAKKIL